MNIKRHIAGYVWKVQQCCNVCHRIAQEYEVTTYREETPKVKFDNNDIPVGWHSTPDGVYCSDECFSHWVKQNKTGESK